MKSTGIQKLCAFFMLGLTIFWALLMYYNITDGTQNYVFSVLTNIIPLVGGIAIIAGAKEWKGQSKLIYRGLICMGLGLIFWAFGGTIWSYYNFFLHMDVPYPSIADIGYAPSEFFYCFGAVYLSRGAGADLGIQKKYAKPLMVIIPIIMFIFSYYILITVGKSGVLFTSTDPLLKTILDLIYPIGDFISLTVSVVISGLYFEFLAKKYRWGIIIVLFGLTAMFFSDFVFSYTTTRGTYFNGNFSDWLSTASLFLLAFGSLYFLETKEKTPAVTSSANSN